MAAIPSRGVLRAEWIKLRSVRSTYATMGCALALGIGQGVLNTAAIAHARATATAQDRLSFDPVGAALDGLSFGVLAFGVLGVLAVSSEHGTGLIRTTLTAVPRRGTVLAAKALVVGALTLVLGELFAFVTFFVGQLALSDVDLDVRVTDPGVLRAVSSAGLYLSVVSLVGLGLGALIRHSAGAIAAMLAVVFLAYGVGRAVESWSYLPSRLVLTNAADVVAQTHAWAPHPRLPSLGAAYLDLALYLVVFLGAGAWRASRDA
jgi:ABC-type transport system involved in multi-copper enzyme maturation permease subunit